MVERMNCVSCPALALENKRACLECIEKANFECVVNYTRSMESLNGLLPSEKTNKAYKQNRDQYEWYRMEILYLTRQLPRPDKKKERKRF